PIAITGGARQALHASILICAGPRNEIIIMPPCFNRYGDIIRANSVRPKIVPLNREDGYQPNMRAIKDAWCERTRAIVATTPNNPTGTAISAQNLAALQEMIRLNRGLLITDETFGAFNFSARSHSSPQLDIGNSIVIGSFSEDLSIPDLRAGYMIAAPEIIERVSRYERCLPSAPPLWVQKLTLELLSNRTAHLDKIRPMIRERQLQLKSALESNPAIERVYADGGTFVWVVPHNAAIVDCRRTIETLAAETGILIMPGDEYMEPGCFRIGVGQITDNTSFGRACDLLGRFSKFEIREQMP
ncbi:MAG: pyridoxal phosphate-dependent aminotransferase, partial [Proteobacteria bacterium]|nr:pyridoxal phosphate-dependent aminotransferase [Pseudomonadota bacterium]